MAATFKLKPYKKPKMPKLSGVRVKMPRSRINGAGKQRFLKSRVGK